MSSLINSAPRPIKYRIASPSMSSVPHQSVLESSRRIEEERREKYRGTASIKLASLNFQDATRRSKAHEENAEAIKRIFEEERGCRQEDSRHHAKAIVSRQVLQAALKKSNVSQDDLLADRLPFPQLLLPGGIRLECIQGHDRLTAADKFLRGEKRWVVDLFLDGSSHQSTRNAHTDRVQISVKSLGYFSLRITTTNGSQTTVSSM